MIEKERQVLIMERIRETGFVSVKELMKELNASRSSIMRDLISLEERGLLEREHGGASLPGMSETLSKRTEPAVSEKEEIHAEEKRWIAQYASKLTRKGMTVFADSGTSAAALAEFLSLKEVTIVTPSVYFIRQMKQNPECTVVLLGGQYDPKYDMNLGEYAMAMLECFRFDIAFLSANAVDPESGDVMAADFALSVMKKEVMKRSRRNVLLADASKFSRLASCPYAKISEFETIITNETEQMEPLENTVRVKEEQK